MYHATFLCVLTKHEKGTIIHNADECYDSGKQNL